LMFNILVGPEDVFNSLISLAFFVGTSQTSFPYRSVWFRHRRPLKLESNASRHQWSFPADAKGRLWGRLRTGSFWHSDDHKGHELSATHLCHLLEVIRTSVEML
jgi:hypothetical protein